MKARLALTFLAGLGLGGILGYSASRWAGAPEAASPERTASREISLRPSTPVGSVSQPPAAPQPAVAAPAPASPQDCAGRVAELERAARACEQQLASCRQPDPDQGQPIPFPPDVPERFQQKVLVESLAAAFKETRVKGEVLVADCDEYPCLACARIGDPAQDVDVTALHKQAARLAGAASLAQFQDAEKVGGTFSARVPGSNAEQLILCQGYYPKPGDPAQAEAIQKRARARIVNMRNAF